MNPPDDINLIRLVWNPDHYDNGVLTTSAFDKSDLVEGRYLSVDRDDIFEPEAAKDTARAQQARANGDTVKRDDARLAYLSCSDVRHAVDQEQTKPFDVTSEPLDKNPAHCGIHNVSGKRGKAYINQLRSILLEAVYREADLPL